MMTHPRLPGILAVILFMLQAAQIHPQDSSGHEIKYYYSGLNYIFPSYPDDLQRRISILRRSPGVSRTPAGIDVIGLYWPYGNKLAGVTMRWSVDNYSGYGNRFTVEYYRISGSVLYYFIHPEKRDKLFFRGDLGPACLRLSSGDKGTEKINFGWGVLAGFGYAFRIRSVSVMPAYHYSIMFIMNKKHRMSDVGVGMLY